MLESSAVKRRRLANSNESFLMSENHLWTADGGAAVNAVSELHCDVARRENWRILERAVYGCV